MEKQIRVKNSSFYTIIVSAAVVGMMACTTDKMEDNPNSKDSKEIAEEHNEQKFDANNDKEKDAQFLVDAAEIHLAEIQLGQYAQNNSTDPEVKKMAKMMESEHTKSLKDLKELALKKSVTIPAELTENNKDAHKELSNKSGRDFDKEYCDKMVEEHKKAIEKFENAFNKSEDSEIKAWASANLPVLRSHLDHALTCQERLEKR